VPRHKQTALTLLRRDVDLQPQQPRVQVDEVVAKAYEALLVVILPPVKDA
jgi:hypothetical protein